MVNTHSFVHPFHAFFRIVIQEAQLLPRDHISAAHYSTGHWKLHHSIERINFQSMFSY